MKRRWWSCGLAAVVFASGVWAAPGVVRTRDGQAIEGDINEKSDTVEVTIRGSTMGIPRDRIESIEYTAAVKEQYQQKLEKLDPKDLQGHLDLAKWAFDQREYELARDAADRAQRIDPNSTEAATMMDTIRNQMRLEQSTNRNNGAGQTPAQTPEVKPVEPRVDRNFLTAEQINVIRQAELRNNDNNVRIRFENDVRRKYTTAANVNLPQFNSRPQIDQALEILDKGDPEFHKDVMVVSDPQALMEFRTVQRTVLSGCAASGCHGGSGAGGFVLFTPATNDAATYSNFYILQNYSKMVDAPRDRPPGKIEARLINRTNPEDSLLLQYGLPTDVAQFDHPEVAGYRGIFRDRNDRRYRDIENWIRNTLRPVNPNYNIDYTPPRGATTQPTTEPASTR